MLLRLAAAYMDRLAGLQAAATAGVPVEDGGLDPQAAGGLLGTLARQDAATARRGACQDRPAVNSDPR